MSYLNHFNINKFTLTNKINEINGKNKNECALYALNNKDTIAGFEYKGDNNQCLLFESNQMTNKLNDDILNNYNIKTFNKTKNTIDMEPIEQTDIYNYYSNINNDYYNIDKLNTKLKVTSEKECLEKCSKQDNCKSIIYLDEPKKCIFYKNKDMKIFDNQNQYQTFSIKNNIPYNYNKTYMNIIPNKPSNLYNTIYNPNNVENNELQHYTDCLDKQFDNYTEQEKYYSSECIKKFGDEYTFDNDNDINTINCTNDNNTGKKAKCKINMYGNNILEHFNDSNNINNNHNNYNTYEITYDYNNTTTTCTDGRCIIYKNDREWYETYRNKKDYHYKMFYLFIFILIITILLVVL